jgi:hypothetical protein
MAGTNHTAPSSELRSNLAVHGFWTRGQTAIFDVRITDTDQPSNRNTDPTKVLLRHEKEKKDKYGALCIARRQTFTPLVFSVDGLLGKEATAASKRLASCLAAKWKRSYSEVCGLVRSQLSIALIRSSSRCLRADRNQTHRFHPPICGTLPDVNSGSQPPLSHIIYFISYTLDFTQPLPHKSPYYSPHAQFPLHSVFKSYTAFRG